MMWRSALSIVFMACVSAPASAAEWWWVSSGGEKPNRRIDFIDKTSFTIDYAGRVLAWDFQINEIPQKNGVRKDKTLYRFDCKHRTMTLIELISYGNNDRLLSSNVWASFEQSERNIVPDSVGESKWEFVCENKSEVSGPVSGNPEEFAAFYFRYDK